MQVCNDNIINFKLLFSKMFIFFACLYALQGTKKTNQQRSGERKGSSSLGPALRDYPVLLETTGSLKTRFAQTIQTPFQSFLWYSAA